MKVPNNKKNYLLILALKQKIWFLKKKYRIYEK